VELKGDFVATVSKKRLNSSLNDIRKDINRGFDEVLERLDALEASDAQNAIAIRNLEIKTRSLAGETYEEIGRTVGLSKSRVGQIVNS
jgi:DNA-directed RNA polymerase sigma subunit (sigma70/sigma32)